MIIYLFINTEMSARIKHVFKFKIIRVKILSVKMGNGLRWNNNMLSITGNS